MPKKRKKTSKKKAAKPKVKIKRKGPSQYKKKSDVPFYRTKSFLTSVAFNFIFLSVIIFLLFYTRATKQTEPSKTRPTQFVSRAPKKSRPTTVSKEKKLSRQTIVQKIFLPIKKKRRFNNTPKIIFVIDDIGNKLTFEALYLELGKDVNYAILPFLSYSEDFAHLSLETKADVILHQPLEAKDGRYPGPGLMTTKMSDDNVLDLLDRNLQTVPFHVGINNHMGSMGTSDYRLVNLLLSDVKRRGLFFLDSLTSSESVIQEVGESLGLPTLRRDVFLDNVDDPGTIREQIYLLTRKAAEKGYAIGIGHDRQNTLEVLLEEIPKVKAAGYEVLSLSDLVLYLETKKKVSEKKVSE